MQAEHLHSNSNDESSSPPSRTDSAATNRSGANPGSVTSSSDQTGNVYAQNLELQQDEIVLPTDTNEGGKFLSKLI